MYSYPAEQIEEEVKAKKQSKVRKHSPSHIKKKADNQAAFIVSHPDREAVGYATSKEFLNKDINQVKNEIAKIVTIKIFDQVEQVPTASRMAEVEELIKTMLPRSEYANIEAQQKVAFEKFVTDLDTKELDVEAFMDYWAQAARVSDVQRLQTLHDEQQEIIDGQKLLIAHIIAEMFDKIHHVENQVGGEVMKDEQGRNYIVTIVGDGLYLYGVSVYRDALKMSHESYSFTPEGTITFETEVTQEEQLDLELSYKKKLNLDPVGWQNKTSYGWHRMRKPYMELAHDGNDANFYAYGENVNVPKGEKLTFNAFTLHNAGDVFVVSNEYLKSEYVDFLVEKVA
jgi:hypothetical protein